MIPSAEFRGLRVKDDKTGKLYELQFSVFTGDKKVAMKMIEELEKVLSTAASRYDDGQKRIGDSS